MHSGITKEKIEAILKCSFSEADIIKLLWKGDDAFSSIHDALKKAEHCICLEFYIFRNDETGSAIADILIQKSLAGIDVRVIYDHFGSLSTPRSFWKRLRSAGIEVRDSYPFSWSDPLDYFRRDHKKLILIDRHTAFLGGLNVANEYSGFHLRRKGRAWRDTGIMLHGPVVRILNEIFLKTWRSRKKERTDDHEASCKCDNIITEEKISYDLKMTDTMKPAIPIFASSSRGRRRFRSLLRNSIQSSEKEILLTTAYFTPGRLMKRCLKNAALKGVSIKLLLPMQSDLPFVDYAGRASYEELLKAGIQIYLYKGDVLHAKTYVFDRQWSIIGSANLDSMSLRYNDEGNIGIFDNEFGKKMARMFEHDIRESVLLSLDEWSERSNYTKVLEKFFHIFRRRL